MFLDTGYDPSSGAFQLGSFDWVALDTGSSQWELTQVEVFFCDGPALDCVFHDLTIQVVPEPSASLVLAIVAWAAMRRTRIILFNSVDAEMDPPVSWGVRNCWPKHFPTVRLKH